MLKRYIFILFSILLVQSAFGQQDPLQLNFEANGMPEEGSTFDVDVRVADFDQLVGMQFIVGWDSLVLEIDTLPFISTDLQDFDINAFSLPAQTANMTRGQLRLLWFNFSPQSLPDDHLLFTIRFNVVGGACDSTTIGEVEFPPNLLTEITDQNFQNIGAVSNDAEAMIPGSNCGGGGPVIGDDEIGLIFTDTSADPGTNICLPFTTVNFDSIETFQGSIMWDPAILEFTGVQNFALPGLSAGSFNTMNTANGTAAFVWFDNTGVTPATIADNGTIFEICFDVIGDLGTKSTVKAFDGSANIQISSPAPVGIRDFVVVEGCVTVGEETEPQFFGIKADSVLVDIVNSEVCVDFTTNNFDDIVGMQYTLQWDPAVLAYNRVEAEIPAFSSTFNAAGNDRLRYSWTNPPAVGLTLPDETVIYRVCFDIVGECEDSTPLSFIGETGRPIEITDGSFTSLPANEVMMIDGRVEIICGINLSTTINNVRCNGESNGSINLMITGGDSPYTVEWEWDNGNGSQLDNGVTINSLIVGQGADTYCVTVTDGVGDTATACYDITEPDPIVISVDVTGNAVSIDYSGGNGMLSDEISPAISDLNNVPDGTYTVTVTDSRGCTETEVFVIGPDCPNPVELGTVVFSAVCGGDGRIEVNCSGGSGDYSISSDPILFFANGAFNDVPAGTYEIICLDNQNSACTETMTVEVLQGTPDDLIVTVSNITNADCTGENGSFDVSVSGGCEPYTTTYTVDNGASMNYVAGASYPAGSYVLIVEDSRGTQASTEFDIETDDNQNLSLDGVTVTDSPCTGMNGQASFTLSGLCGSLSCEVLVNGTNAQACSLTDNGDGSYSGDFPVGTHTITLTDDLTGMEVSNTFTIDLSPNALRATVQSAMDGAIDINVLGGTAPFSFFWMDPDGNAIGDMDTEDLSGLTVTGLYSVTIIDALGCSFALSINLPGDGELDLRVDDVDQPFGGFATPCIDECMGAISGNITGGQAPYTVILTDENAQDQSFEISGEGSFDLDNLCAGSYMVELMDNDGNAVTWPNTLIINAPGPIIIVEDEINCPDMGQSNGSISAAVSGGTGLGYVYSWVPENNDPIPGPTNESLAAGSYTLIVEDSNGCQGQASFDLLTDCMEDSECFEARRVITPNEDGANDFFVIRCVNNMGYSLSVFDRWSELVYSSSNYQNDWNGIDIDGEELPEGAYYWVLETGSQVYRGTVTLLRN